MAGALRPSVLLIIFASLLFMLTGSLDSVTALKVCPAAFASPGCLDAAAAPMESIAFGLVNLFVAILIARGSERMLAFRIALAAFFVIERPVTAVALGSHSTASVGLHVTTAFVEAVILLLTLRVWRLGHTAVDMSAFSLPVSPDEHPSRATR